VIPVRERHAASTRAVSGSRLEAEKRPTLEVSQQSLTGNQIAIVIVVCGRYNSQRGSMADSSVQKAVEQWVREHCLATRYSQTFARQRLRLSSGGEYSFDAVSADGTIVATISTSGSQTASGKRAAAKLHKIRADLYFLLLTHVPHRVVVLTESDMMSLCEKEACEGRVPQGIEFVHAKLPSQLIDQLQAARTVASREVTPSGVG